MHSLQHMSSRTSGLLYSGRDLQRINKVRRAAGREPIHNRSVKVRNTRMLQYHQLWQWR